MNHFRNMASRKKAGNGGVQEKGANGKQLSKHKDGPIGRVFSCMYCNAWCAVLLCCCVAVLRACGTLI